MFKALCTTLAVLCLWLSMGQKAAAQDVPATTTVIIMRHAEKETGKGSDPGLSAAGKQRAERIVNLLKDVPLTHLLSTPYTRTQHTLLPLAKATKLAVEPYDPAHPEELVKSLQTAAGQTFVIAGHANTAPELVNLLLNRKQYAALAEDDFGKVWIVTLQSGKAISCLLLNTN